MDLILWRHAQAVDTMQAALSDLDRPLTSKGHRQAMAMASWLQGAAPQGAVLLTSPARRTLETARALASHPPEVRVELSPDRSADDLLRLVGWPAPGGCVIVVGHQPTLGEVACRLLTGAHGQAPSWSIKKGAIWWLRHRADRGGRVELVAVRSAMDGQPG